MLPALALVAWTTVAAGAAGERAVSVVTACTAGLGANVFGAGAGWPGVHLSYQRGVAQGLDLGTRVSVNYGYEGLLAPLTGVRLQLLLKLLLAENGRVNVGLTLEPGVLLYFPAGALVAFTVPLALTLGMGLGPDFNLAFAVELAAWLRPGPGGGSFLPLLGGAGLEYFVTAAVVVWLRARAGPTFFSYGGAPAATLDAKVGVGWRF